MTISDIIEAKQRIMARYESLEYIDNEIKKGKSIYQINIENADRSIVLTELIIAICDTVIQRMYAESPVNIDKERQGE